MFRQHMIIICASRNPTSPARKAPVEASKKNSFKRYHSYKAHGTQIVTRNLQNGAQKLPKSRSKPFKIKPKWGQEGPGRPKNRKIT